MAQTCSHKDVSREKVGSTAHFVASLRAMEHKREDGLFSDPYAELLGDDFGDVTLSMYPSGLGKDVLESSGDKNLADEAVKKIPKGLVNGVAVRTRKIDDEAKQFLLKVPHSQVCVLGAGLDTRPWRIDDTNNSSKIKYFEVDFPEMFQYKLSVLSDAGASSKFDYISVNADLSLPGWTDKLIAAGFNPTMPTFWLLEGFTGYLTAAEFHAVFETMTSLSADGSRLVATFLTPSTLITTTMHRFTPEVPIEEVTRHSGWQGEQVDIRDIGKALGREWDDASMNGYVIVLADYSSSQTE